MDLSDALLVCLTKSGDSLSENPAGSSNNKNPKMKIIIARREI